MAKKNLKGIPKQRRKDTPVLSKMVELTTGLCDAMTREPIFMFFNNEFESRRGTPKVDFLDVDEFCYSEKLLDCQTLLQGWIQIIVANSLCFLTQHQKTILEEVVLKGKTPMDVARERKMCKTAVHHSIYGIFIPEYNKFHGGSLRKLKSIIEKSPEYHNYKRLKKVLASKPSEKYLDIFLEYAKDRRFSYILSEKLLMINPYTEESNYEQRLQFTGIQKGTP